MIPIIRFQCKYNIIRWFAIVSYQFNAKLEIEELNNAAILRFDACLDKDLNKRRFRKYL